MTVQPNLDRQRKAVLQLTAKRSRGRGFVVQGRDRLVITAAHCLPHLPPAHAGSYLEDKTYQNLLGPLGKKKPKVWAECLFVDPVADVAVLGCPDDQELWEQAEAYETLTEAMPALRLGPPPKEGEAWLLMLDGHWARCTVDTNFGHGTISIDNASEGIHGGMSGSPIIDSQGKAIGIVSISGGTEQLHSQGGPEPSLVANLPGWLLRELRLPRPKPFS